MDPLEEIKTRATDFLFAEPPEAEASPPERLSDEQVGEIFREKIEEGERLFKEAQGFAMKGPLKGRSSKKPTAIAKREAAEAKLLLKQARKYNPECKLTCRRALVKVLRATDFMLKCAKMDKKLHEQYFKCLELTIELIVVFEVRLDDWSDECGCTMTDEELCEDGLHGVYLYTDSSSMESSLEGED